MSEADRKLAELGLVLPEPPVAAGAYVPCVVHHGLVYVSGQLAIEGGRVVYAGRLGSDLGIEDGQKAAALAARNALAQLKRELGDLDRVSRCLKLTGYVAAVDGFTGHAAVINGASDLIYQVFGERGRHARAALGVSSLPLGSAVEIEFLFAVA
jgi:enamine deaminase RidA (YjgF/YER057c/UK114 family)